MTQSAILSLPQTLNIASTGELEETISRAVEQAIKISEERPGNGLLVTRHDDTTLTLELSSEVPHGFTVVNDRR
ncbi:hypothetical protein AB0284_14715 [Pseudarthrobacter phenanthrenivorans]|uniref:hypothetical protein n=1 Tax=Pseudarthrobacter phenanthrenivorans TaxID=361575 RepID=UPI00344BE763